MQNLYLNPSDSPSTLYCIAEISVRDEEILKLDYPIDEGDWDFTKESNHNFHIYITVDNENIIHEDYVLDEKAKKIIQREDGKFISDFYGIIIEEGDLYDVNSKYKKIIATTDPFLIDNGIQALPDDFIDWYYTNNECQSVEIEPYFDEGNVKKYKITLPEVDSIKKDIGCYKYGHYYKGCEDCREFYLGALDSIQCKSCAISNPNKQQQIEFEKEWERKSKMLYNENETDELIKNILKNLETLKGFELIETNINSVYNNFLKSYNNDKRTRIKTKSVSC